jgi:hypothetical protein
MACENCGTDRATRWLIFDKGELTGAAHCDGHELALCDACADWSDRKGCPLCFW